MTLNWLSESACRKLSLDDADALFFAWSESEEASKAGKAVCGECPVRLACLAYADQNGFTDGIYGGLTTTEREAAGFNTSGKPVLGEPEHGTVRKYHAGCRCDECVTERRLYNRNIMRRVRERKRGTQ